MMPFAPFQIEALHQLGRLWPPERCVLIGASALGCFMEMRWRQTFDLDLSLAASFDECANLLRSLPGWSLDPQVEHRWLAAGGSQIDVIPAGPDLLNNGTERLTTERFVAAIKNEDDPLGTQANFLAAGPASWRHHSGEFMRSVCAFARGLTR
jgi:hypothetical protein